MLGLVILAVVFPAQWAGPLLRAQEVEAPADRAQGSAEAVGREATGAQEDDTVEAATRQGSRLQGLVYLNRNRMVVGATVLVRPQDDSSHVFVTSSDEKGRFRVEDLPDGTYEVAIDREGLERVVKQKIALRFPFRAVIELPMKPQTQAPPAPTRAPGGAAPSGEPIRLRGKVLERGGGPIPEVAVRFVRPDGQADPRPVRTDGAGSFELQEFLPGEWRLEARGAGYLPIRIGLDLAQDAEVRVALVPQPAEYDPSPLELMPPEEPIAPPDLPEVLVVE
jgi:hypothetical protein